MVKDLINHQKTEIERLYETLGKVRCEQYTNGRNDGIREFAEKLKKKHYFYKAEGIGDCYRASGIDIDSLVKELTEGHHD